MKDILKNKWFWIVVAILVIGGIILWISWDKKRKIKEAEGGDAGRTGDGAGRGTGAGGMGAGQGKGGAIIGGGRGGQGKGGDITAQQESGLWAMAVSDAKGMVNNKAPMFGLNTMQDVKRIRIIGMIDKMDKTPEWKKAVTDGAIRANIPLYHSILKNAIYQAEQ